MNDFSSLQELYLRLTPAFSSKMHEVKLKGYNYVKAIDIWNYLSEKKWNNKKDLSLYEMVDDILNANNEELNSYVLNILKKQNREIYFDEDIL